MQILPQMNLNDKSNPHFGMWNRGVFQEIGRNNFPKLIHRNDTSFVRKIGTKKDISNAESWRRVMDLLADKFKNIQNVNIYNYACSDCSEIYTFLMAKMSRIGKEKNFNINQIYAIDYDKAAIDKAKKGEYKLSKREYDSIQDLTNNNIDKFLEINFDKETETYHAKAKEILTSKVKLIHADALKDCKRIEQKNSIVLACNFWPYLNEKMAPLLESFNNRLKENSVLMIGNFDARVCPYYGFNIIKEIIKKGFKRSSSECLFEK